MKAQTFYKYAGPEVLSIKDIPKPIPKDDQVLIKVKYAGVAAGDWHVLRGEPFAVRAVMGLLKPKNPVLGFEVSGIIEEVGKEVSRFKKGDEVFGEISGGGFAEYVAAKTNKLAIKPKSIPHAIAATLPVSSLTALQAVRDQAKVKKGEKVLVIGASGGVGSFACQIAKYYGAKVTAVVSTKAVSKIKPIADHIIDYKKDDVVKLDKQYEVIIDAAAYRDYKLYDKILTKNGRYILVGGSGKQLFRIMFFGRFMKKTFKNFLSKSTPEDMSFVIELVQKKKIKPVMDKTFLLKDLKQAIEHLEKRKAIGKSVIKIG